MDLKRSRRYVAAVALACALLGAHCSSSSTSVVAPSPAGKCQVSVSSTPSSFSAAGGSGSVSISTARDCTWSVAAEAGWLSIAGTHAGQGDGTVRYTVAQNPAPAPRSGSIAVGSEKLQVSQAGVPCHFNLTSTRGTVGADGGPLSLGVTTVTGCSWTAASGVTWVAVQSGQTGNANGTVGLMVAANAGPARVGIVNVAGQTYTVSQKAKPGPGPTEPPEPPPNKPPDPPPPPPPPPPDPPAGDLLHFTGAVSGLSGSCPNLKLLVWALGVVTDQSTNFKRGRCEDVQNDAIVEVSGSLLPSLAIHATEIELKK